MHVAAVSQWCVQHLRSINQVYLAAAFTDSMGFGCPLGVGCWAVDLRYGQVTPWPADVHWLACKRPITILFMQEWEKAEATGPKAAAQY